MVAIIAYGCKKSSSTKVLIQAPLIPSVTRTRGAMQQRDAVMPAVMAPNNELLATKINSFFDLYVIIVPYSGSLHTYRLIAAINEVMYESRWHITCKLKAFQDITRVYMRCIVIGYRYV